MTQRLRILHLEDDPMDAELVQMTLTAEGLNCEVEVVSRRDEFGTALQRGGIDLILADFALPAFDGMSALAMVREKWPDLPFVFVSGKLGEEAAIESLKSGATDYVLKNRLSRLVPAVQRALTEAKERVKQRQTEQELERAYEEIQRRAEDYHNLFNSIRDVIIVTDDDRKILHVNQPALQDVFGYRTEEVVDKSSSILFADEQDFRQTGTDLFDSEKAKGRLLELNFLRKNGEIFIGELYAMKRFDQFGVATGNVSMFRDISEKKRAEAALRDSELRRYQLQVELHYAAEIQAKLLPRSYPQIPGFEVAAKCLPAKQVGGDFYDWQQVSPTVFYVTLGDVMGKGMAAAMLMATVRAALHAVTLYNSPGQALHLAEKALFNDLENSESFVTLFHGQLNAEQRSFTFVDCGHGYVFVKRSNNGTVESLLPRGLPLGVQGGEIYQEGVIKLEVGDVLVLYSDGLIDANPQLSLSNQILAEQLSSQEPAQQMVDRLIALTGEPDPQPDDITVLVVRCTG